MIWLQLALKGAETRCHLFEVLKWLIKEGHHHCRMRSIKHASVRSLLTNTMLFVCCHRRYSYVALRIWQGLSFRSTMVKCISDCCHWDLAAHSLPLLSSVHTEPVIFVQPLQRPFASTIFCSLACQFYAGIFKRFPAKQLVLDSLQVP